MPIPDYVNVRPEDREAVEKLLETNPELFASPDSKKVTDLQGQIDQMLGDYNDWKKWHDETYPLAQAWEADNVKLKAQLAEYEAAKKEAAAKQETTPANTTTGAPAATADQAQRDLEARLQAGFITKSDFEDAIKRVREETQTQTLELARKEFTEKIYPNLTQTILGISEAGIQFTSEFPGEKWNRQEFLQYAKDNGINDVTKAYQGYTAERRQKAQVAKAVEDALTAERAKVAQQSIPGSAPARAQDMGILEQRARNVKTDVQLPENTNLGSGQLARMAAEELRREGKTDFDTQRGVQ